MPVVTPSGYQFTLAEIRTKVRALLMQTTAANSRWTDAMLNNAINLALDDLRLEGVCEMASSSFTTTAGDQTWRPPADVWKLLDVIFDGNTTCEITRADMDAISGGDLDRSSGTPDFWYKDSDDSGMLIRFDKTFGDTGKTVEFWYLKRAQDMTDDAEYTTLYKAYAPAIVYRVLMLAHAGDENGQAYQMWQAEYAGALEKAKLHMQQPNESDGPEMRCPYEW
jgi:hypothetical protein